MDPVMPISPAELLALWERHDAHTPLGQSLALLAASARDGASPDVESLTVHERDRELVRLRRCIFGDRIESCTHCPDCGEEIELSVRTSELVDPEDEGGAPPAPLVVDRYTVEFRLPTCRDLAACVRLPAGREHELLAACIVEATCAGQEVAAEDLPDRVRRLVAERLAELDDDAIVELSADCPACEAAFVVPFDITSHLWEELAAWSARLFDDIHTLAWAYGWSESQILALSPGRRDRYVERALQ
jgi:hypothetical protein